MPALITGPALYTHTQATLTSMAQAPAASLQRLMRFCRCGAPLRVEVEVGGDRQATEIDTYFLRSSSLNTVYRVRQAR